jgi:hypothetical protein
MVCGANTVAAPLEAATQLAVDEVLRGCVAVAAVMTSEGIDAGVVEPLTRWSMSRLRLRSTLTAGAVGAVVVTAWTRGDVESGAATDGAEALAGVEMSAAVAVCTEPAAKLVVELVLRVDADVVEEAVAAESSESSITEVGAGSAMTRGGVAVAAVVVVELMVETVRRGRGGNAANLDEADAAAAGARIRPSSLRTIWRRSPIVRSSLVWRSPNAVSSLALDSAKLRSTSRASWALRTSYVARPSGERLARSSARRRGKSMGLIGEKICGG